MENTVKGLQRSRSYLKDVLYKSRKEDLDSIFFHLSALFINYPMNVEYINLKSSGNLGLISDKNIRNTVVYYYELYHKNHEHLAIEHKKFANNQVEAYFREELPGDTTLLYNPEIVELKLKDKKFRNIIIEQIRNLDYITNTINTSTIDHIIGSIAKDTIK